MPRIKIDKQRCKGCYLCMTNCPNGLIKIEANINVRGVRPVVFYGGRCTGCAMCAVICPDRCITVLK